MKLQLDGIGGITDGMYPNELQINGQDRETTSNSAKRGGRMKREAGYEGLEQMSLESLLYYVLVGDGRAAKEIART